jgi:hypothetical protein
LYATTKQRKPMNFDHSNPHDLLVVPSVNLAALMLGLTEVHQLVSIGAALAALVYTVLKIVQLYRDLK